MDVQSHQESQEEAVGINVFVTPQTRAFQCILKQRYTDFLVNEILPDGNVLHLVKQPVDTQHKRKRDPENIQPSQQEVLPQKKARIDVSEADAKADNATAEAKENGHAKPEGTDRSIKDVKAAAIASISEADRNELNNIFGSQVTTSILNLYASVAAHPDRKARDHSSVKSEPIQEKSQRTDAHLRVRRIFHSKLETLTIQDQDQQSGPGTIISIKAAPPKTAANQQNQGRENGRQGGRQNWSDLGGEYIHFTLYKENKDTMEVLYYIAAQLKLATKHFSFAGTKDRRGVTVQRVAVFHMRKERLEGLNRTARGWRLGGPWEYRKEGLDLGMLKGNEFLITLRDAQFASEESGWDIAQRLAFAKAACASATQQFSDRGFLNYYGLQRFGTHSTGTHLTGMCMLQGDLKGAIDSILTYDPALVPQEGESTNPANVEGADGTQKKIPQDDIARAKAIHSFVTTGSSQETIAHLPGNRFSAEKGIITYLAKRDRKTGQRPNANDYQGALMQIQRNLRLMYVHAYQSHVWNTMAGKRWGLYGDRVVEGDLVLVGEKELEEGAALNPGNLVDEVDEDGEPIIHPNATTASGVEDSNGLSGSATGGASEDPFARGRALSKAEAESGRFTIFDVVLPLPGYDVEYPSNDLGTLYEEFMASEKGGGLDPHNMRRAWKDISLSGGYRKLMARPLGRNVDVDVRAYTKVDEQMVETDLEKMMHTEGRGDANLETGGGRGMSAVHDELMDERPKIAVVLKLQLASSQYATMALRELTKGGAKAYQPDYSIQKR